MRDLCIKCGYIDEERDTNNIHCKECKNNDLYPLYDNVIEYILSLRAKIATLKEAGDGLAKEWVANFDGDLYCVHCKERVREGGSILDYYSNYVCDHSPDCPVTLWKAVRGD